MLDYAIRSGTLIDGSGGPIRQADIGIRDGRIVAVGQVDEPAEVEFDATGLMVAPGVVDPHTHYDAQLFWDPSASPSNVHGVTTVIGGNCGFTLAPINAEDADYIRRMMAKVEGMPLTALEHGVPWTWSSFAEYLEALEGNLGVNAGFLVGHCALRRKVMGAARGEEVATDDEIESMRALLRESLAAGGLGFSSSQSRTHSDGDGRPISSRYADRREMLAFCEEVEAHEGTTLEYITNGCLDNFSPEEVDLMTTMSVTAQRPLNWNVLTVDARSGDRIEHQLSASSAAAAAGGRIVALTMPTLVPMNMSFRTHCALFLIPGWGDVMGLPEAGRKEKLADPAVRAQLDELAHSKEAGVFRGLARWGTYVIGDTYAPANDGCANRTVADIAEERGTAPFDTLLDIVLADDLRTVLWPNTDDGDENTWSMRAAIWSDPRAMVGGSDAGAAPRPHVRFELPHRLPGRQSARPQTGPGRTGSPHDDGPARRPLRPARPRPDSGGIRSRPVRFRSRNCRLRTGAPGPRPSRRDTPSLRRFTRRRPGPGQRGGDGARRCADRRRSGHLAPFRTRHGVRGPRFRLRPNPGPRPGRLACLR